MPDDPNTGEVEGTPPPWQEVSTPKEDPSDREAVRAEDAEDEEFEEPEVMRVDSAFVVFFQDGEAFGVGSLGTVSLKIEDEEVLLDPIKTADTSMMWRGCTEVAKDIVVHEQATKTVEALQARTMQMHQALQQQNQSPGGGRLHVPGQ